MKAILPSIILVLGCLAAGVRAQQAPAPPAPPDDFNPEKSGELPQAKIKYVLINPDEKTAVDVKANERNPFGQSVDELQVVSGKGTTEENAIRTHLEKLKIVGASAGPNGPRIMLGDMVLATGEKVPPVLPDQTLNLRVGRITEHSIELVWIEKKSTGMPPRLLTLPVDLRPYVRHALMGQASAEKDEAKKKEKKGKNETLVMGNEIMQLDDTNGPAALLSDAVKGDTPPSAASTNKGDDTPVISPPIVRTAAPATAAPAPTVAPQEPEEWKRAVGLLNNLTKLEEAKN